MPSQGSNDGGGGGGGRRRNYYNDLNDLALQWTKTHHTSVSAGISSIVSTAIAFPLDSVKTRMQTYKYAGLVDCVQRTYKTEGLRGFFRGVVAPISTITLVRTTSMSIYTRSKHAYAEQLKKHLGVDVIGQINKKGSYPTFWTVGCFGAAGATAGLLITFMACPFELCKLVSQVSVVGSEKQNCPSDKCHAVAASYRDKGTFRTMANIVKHRGFAGLYTGVKLHLLRDSIGTGLYFATYESAKQLMTTLGNEKSNSNPLAVLASGGICGIVSWALIYPIDSAKSIYQRNAMMYSKGETVKPVKIEFFKRQMYRGLGVSMARSCAINAMFFSSYEYLKKTIKALPEREDD